MGRRLLLRIYILEGEQGGVGSRSNGICIAKDMIIISLLDVTVESFDQISVIGTVLGMVGKRAWRWGLVLVP